MSDGFGNQPFGSSPYGIGTPAVYPGLGGAILRDAKTGASLGSRRIDPRTRDYVVDSNGRILGMSKTQQLVYLAVSTTKGSAAMRSLGHELAKIDRISGNFFRRLSTTLHAAVQDLVNSGLIVVLGVRAQLVRPGVVYVALKWRDVSAKTEHSTSVGSNQLSGFSDGGGFPATEGLFDETGNLVTSESGGDLNA